MKITSLRNIKPRGRLLLAGCLLAALVLFGWAGSTPAKAQTHTKRASALTGAELYAMHCSRCHPERYPTEWKAGQWKTIVLEMRVRANLPAKQARKILKYLQEDSGN